MKDEFWNVTAIGLAEARLGPNPTNQELGEYIYFRIGEGFIKVLGAKADSSTITLMKAYVRNVISDAVRLGADPTIQDVEFELYYLPGAKAVQFYPRKSKDPKVNAAWEELFPPGGTSK